MGFRLECEGEGWESPAGTTPSEAARGAGLNPEAFVFIVDGMPIPMDSPIGDGVVVKAIRVASGG